MKVKNRVEVRVRVRVRNLVTMPQVRVLTKKYKRAFWLLLHEVPVQLGSVYVVHDGLQPSLEPGFKSDVIL